MVLLLMLLLAAGPPLEGMALPRPLETNKGDQCTTSNSLLSLLSTLDINFFQSDIRTPSFTFARSSTLYL